MGGTVQCGECCSDPNCGACNVGTLPEIVYLTISGVAGAGFFPPGDLCDPNICNTFNGTFALPRIPGGGGEIPTCASYGLGKRIVCGQFVGQDVAAIFTWIANLQYSSVTKIARWTVFLEVLSAIGSGGFFGCTANFFSDPWTEPVDCRKSVALHAPGGLTQRCAPAEGSLVACDFTAASVGLSG